jgi:hypothetical protein
VQGKIVLRGLPGCSEVADSVLDGALDLPLQPEPEELDTDRAIKEHVLAVLQHRTCVRTITAAACACRALRIAASSNWLNSASLNRPAATAVGETYRDGGIVLIYGLDGEAISDRSSLGLRGLGHEIGKQRAFYSDSGR